MVLGSKKAVRLMSMDNGFQNTRVLGSKEMVRLTLAVLASGVEVKQLGLCPHSSYRGIDFLEIERRS